MSNRERRRQKNRHAKRLRIRRSKRSGGREIPIGKSTVREAPALPQEEIKEEVTGETREAPPEETKEDRKSVV